MADSGGNHENQFLTVIRVWAALAWADGVIRREEDAAMRRLVDMAGLSEGDRATALSFLESQVSLDTAGLAGLDDGARVGVYSAAVRLSRVDNDVAAEEVAFLERLREGLGLSAERAEEIRAQIR